MPTLTKPDLARRVAEACGITLREAERLITATFDAIAQALGRGEKVELRGFGSFRVRQRRPRRARNPRTGTPVQTPAKRVPFFRASTLFKAWLAAEAGTRPRPGRPNGRR